MSEATIDQAAAQPPRTARLVLVTPDGRVLGILPPVAAATPWWQDAGPVVRAVRDRFGIDATILRLLETGRDRPHGGAVTYLAEVKGLARSEPVPAEPWAGALDEQPLRLPYARPGGPAADLAWARQVLDRHGLRPVASPVQIRSWNLSSIWRIPVEGQGTWLKVVPPFFAHEGRLLERLAGGPVPRLLGQEGGRVLLAEIPARICTRPGRRSCSTWWRCWSACSAPGRVGPRSCWRSACRTGARRAGSGDRRGRGADGG